MIKAIILDIDGVIVGEKNGFNFPTPHKDVLKRLREVHSKGIPIILCSAKPHYSIQDIIQESSLDNPHITDAGALIIDPLENKTIAKHVIDPSLVKELLKFCIDNNIYVEFYTENDYFIQKDQASEITRKHKPILQKDPTILSDISDESTIYDILRIMPIAHNEEDKRRVDALLSPYKNRLSISWGLHPSALPLQFCIITAIDSSKKKGAEIVIKTLGFSFQDVLGIGDTTGDWSFIELCGYAATLENGTLQLKELIKSKGEGKYFIGKTVDKNGILDILKYFHLSEKWVFTVYLLNTRCFFTNTCNNCCYKRHSIDIQKVVL